MEKRMKKFKILLGFQKERLWLEDMAQKGWFLENITWGIFYTFRADEPKNMMYEIDRFNLPKKPTLEEIKHKEVFMEMAAELGWSEVTHDESMTYYFCKEYKEGEINELYNDEESRKLRAAKFSTFLEGKAQEVIFWNTIMILMDILVLVLDALTDIRMPVWFHKFCLVYVLICNLYVLWVRKISRQTEKEMSLSRAEWERQRDTTRFKKESKMILR